MTNLQNEKLLVRLVSAANETELYGIDTQTIADICLFSSLIDTKKFHKASRVIKQFFEHLTVYIHHNHDSLSRTISRRASQNLILGFSQAKQGSDATWVCLLQYLSLSLNRELKVKAQLQKPDVISLIIALADRKVFDKTIWTILLKTLNAMISQLQMEEICLVMKSLRQIRLKSD